ncbi:hypothetical protein IW150_002866, partial [Coemansia sp. RSA 2607]
ATVRPTGQRIARRLARVVRRVGRNPGGHQTPRAGVQRPRGRRASRVLVLPVARPRARRPGAPQPAAPKAALRHVPFAGRNGRVHEPV